MKRDLAFVCMGASLGTFGWGGHYALFAMAALLTVTLLALARKAEAS